MSGSNVGREQEIFGSDRAMGESGVQQAWQRQPCAGHWHGGKPPRITQPTFSPQASLTSPSAQPGLILTRLQNRSLVRKRLDAGEWRYVNEHRGVCVCVDIAERLCIWDADTCAHI